MIERFFLATSLVLLSSFSIAQIYTPIRGSDRQAIDITLTEIGAFGLWRKERPKIPGHFHTGIDIKRPFDNYTNEPIFPIAHGIVISKRTDGPYAQLIIEHMVNGKRFWTVYEHLGAILVELEQEVDPFQPIALFMNKDQLNTFGWQFDHFHFEILKKPPLPIKPDDNHPFRKFRSHTLVCFTVVQLHENFYNPFTFFEKYF